MSALLRLAQAWVADSRHWYTSTTRRRAMAEALTAKTGSASTGRAAGADRWAGRAHVQRRRQVAGRRLRKGRSARVLKRRLAELGRRAGAGLAVEGAHDVDEGTAVEVVRDAALRRRRRWTGVGSGTGGWLRQRRAPGADRGA